MIPTVLTAQCVHLAQAALVLSMPVENWLSRTSVLVANSARFGQAVSGCNCAKAQCRVCAFGSPDLLPVFLPGKS